MDILEKLMAILSATSAAEARSHYETLLSGVGRTDPNAEIVRQLDATLRNIDRAPIDLSTGLPATTPPAGSNVISPYAVGAIPPTNWSAFGGGGIGSRNEGIYPTRR